MINRLQPLAAAACLAFAFSAHAAKPAQPAAKQEKPAHQSAEVEIAHNLSPAGAERLQGLVERFNKEHGASLKLGQLEKGEKPAALNVISAYDTSEILTRAANFVPLHELMTRAKAPVNAATLSPDLLAGVRDAKGRLVALPLLYSTPVMFYDKAAFRKARLDPEKPPKTWFEMQGMLDKLQEAGGYACPYTTSWPVWIHIDNLSILSSVPAVDSKGNLAFNGMPQVKHVAMMTTWVKANYFKLFGRRDEASKRFAAGECAMITTNSREYVDFAAVKGADLGVAPMPYHDDVYGGRQHTLADGPTLWIGAGRPAAEYAVAARFVSFLLAPDIQIELVRVYGGLPLTTAARAAARSKLLKDADGTLEVAYASLKGRGATPDRHVSHIDAVRIIANEELEKVWSDKTPAKAGLDAAVQRGNAYLNAHPAMKKAQPF